MNILVVDDHMDIRTLCKAVIENLGHQVVAVPSAMAALAATTQTDFDLVVSDILLPDGNGNDLLRELRRTNPDLHAIAISGLRRGEDVRRSQLAGFAVHLAKPFDLDTLRQTIVMFDQRLIHTAEDVA